MNNVNKIRFEQLLAETKSRLRRELINSNLLIVPGSEELVTGIVEDSIRKFKGAWENDIPKRSPSLDSITCYDNKVIGWHYVDGVKRMIAQQFENDKIFYYTDGIKEKV